MIEKNGRVIPLRILSNEMLIDSYFKAMDLKLDKEFIGLLRQEIERRNLNPKFYRFSTDYSAKKSHAN
jgi:developmental checkpoint coupling sporulation initiation to replication initiation